MKNFTFHNPTRLIFGTGTIGLIGEEIARNGHKLVLLIAGGGSIKKTGVYDQVVESLRKADRRWEECWGVQPNPVLSKVREMIQQARRLGVDAILAVGGGSVIDSAKAVAAGYYVDDVWQLFERDEPVTRALPLYTVLTLSATGTEMNCYAVVTNEAEKKKWAIGGPALYPRVSVVDPSVQVHLPWKQTVNGAVDSISHILEHYFLGGGETTLALDESLLRTIVQVTDRLQQNPSDYEARASLAWASTLALNGISGAGLGDGDWTTHALEHGLSGAHPEIAHAEGLAVLFPAWILYCQDANPPLFQRWARNVWGASTVEAAVEAYRNKLRSWQAPVTLKELGIQKQELKEIAQLAYDVGNHGVVKRLELADFERILESAYE